MRKYIVEFIGTFFLVFTIGMVVINPGGAGSMAPLAIASALMAMIYAGGHISGAHYNPAVTLGVFVRGKCSVQDAVPYVIAQILGSFVASSAVLFLKSYPTLPEFTPLQVGPALLAEFLFTFALVFVILNVATAKATAGNSFYGLAIGFTVLAGAYAVGSISGGAFNPAVALGLCWMGLAGWSDLWIFLAANLLGGLAAGLAFKVVSEE